ncbi:MAG: hypothetical protein HY644_13355 [Acidobacteria bacterium]|nr:hypothetical protein [Acidobacteriota bacterium]
MKIEGSVMTGLSMLLVVPLMLSSLMADAIYFKDGRSVDGTYLGGTAQMVRFRVSGLIRTYPVSEIQDIQFGAAEGASDSAVASPTPSQPAPSQPSATQPALNRSTTGSAPTPLRRVAARDEYVVAAGTMLRVRTNELIDSERSRVGDNFSASIDQDVIVDGELLAERGSPVKLRIAQMEEAGEFKGRTILVLDLVEMTVGNSIYAVSATPVEQSGESQGKRTGAMVGGGAALGAIIGAIAGGGKGAAIGAAVGGASGAGVQVLTRGEKLKIPAETVLEFNLQKDLFLRR